MMNANDQIGIENKVADLLRKNGSFEILSKDLGRYTLTVDGKTVSADIDIDALTYGGGMEDPSEVKEFEDIMNQTFSEACTSIAFQLGWLI